MPKRKRNFDADTTSPPSPTGPNAPTIITTRLTTTITQATTQLKKALTLARGFERQKLGRRQKAANHEPHTLLKLREEVIVLKGLDLGFVAERQLLRRLGRVKRVVESQAWKAIYGRREAESVKGEAEGRVVGRLMGSAAVKECADRIVGRVMDALGLEAMVAGKMKEGLKETAVNGQEVKIVYGRGGGLTRADGDEWSGSESEEEDEKYSADDLDPGDDLDLKNSTKYDPDASGNDTDASSDFSGFSTRIASSPAESEVSSSNVEVSEERFRTGRQTLNSSQTPDLDVSTVPKTLTKTSKPIPAPPSSTAFLPSLMMGGYYSGSESASEIDDVDTKPRKNRRGQRERQKIAEAKYGSGAKHIAKQSSNSNRNAGWDARNGATDTAKDGNGKFNGKGRMRIGRPGGASAIDNGNTNGGSKAPTGANGDGMGAGRKKHIEENGGAMHPSWEAARKRKEQGSKISINIGNGGGGTGTKITFD